MSVEARRTKAGKTRYLARVRSGTQLVASKTFDRKGDAEAWEREQKHRLDTGRPLPPKRKFTLGELVDVFLAARANGNPHTIDTDRNNLAALPKALRARSLATVQAGDIRDHLLAELRGGKAPSTVARAKTTLSALFTYADEQGFLHQPHPVQTMKKIPELGTVAQRALNPSEIPTPRRVAAVLTVLRQRRSDIADVFEFMSLTGVRWGELRAIRVGWLSEVPLAQLNVERSHSDRYEEKGPKSWRGTRPVPLSPRALAIFRQYAAGKAADDYLFTNQQGGQLSVGVVRKFPLGFRRHALRHYAASTWLRLGTPVHEVAEYLGDDPRTVLAVYAHILGEGQRRDHVRRLAAAEKFGQEPGHSRDTRRGPSLGI
jgi:integrase